MVAANPTWIEQPTSRIVMRGISWQTYKTLMLEVGDDRTWRIAYDRGVLEIRMPLEEHEEPKGLLESFVEAIAEVANFIEQSRTIRQRSAVRLFRQRIQEILNGQNK